MSSLIKAVIFDMDGTVSDSIAAEYIAWKKLFGDFGKKLNYNDFTGFMGIRSTEIIDTHLGLAGKELEKALLSKTLYFKEYIETNGVYTIPGVETFLQELKKIPLKICLASGARRQKAEFILSTLNLRAFFDGMVTAEDVPAGKPDPAVFLLAASRIGVDPEDCLVFEDSENGVIAAKRAGMQCIALTTTTALSRLGEADLIISSYRSHDPVSLFRQLESRRLVTAR
jgi:HAD superfamily hydrolase (TIGR01509 family)